MTNLEDIMMRYPSALKALYLDNNRLQGFHHETFSGQTYIDVLSMSDNKLERIPKGVFKELINLFRLSLANNRIAVIEDFAFEGLPRVCIYKILFSTYINHNMRNTILSHFFTRVSSSAFVALDIYMISQVENLAKNIFKESGNII